MSAAHMEVGNCAVDTPLVFSQREIEEMDTDTLLRLYKQTGNQELKWPLVLRYEGLVKSAALQVRGIYSSFAQAEDIINEGILTLLTAVDKFDPDKGIRFETFVSKRIRGMIIDLARKQDWLSRSVRRRAKEIDQRTSELANTLGRAPTEAEIIEELEIQPEKYRRDMASVALSNILSLDELIEAKQGEGVRFEIASDDTSTQPEVALQDRELLEILAQEIAKLRENEQIVLSLYYEKNLHMKEIAQVMQVSEPRISQIHARALRKLREHLERYMTGR